MVLSRSEQKRGAVLPSSAGCRFSPPALAAVSVDVPCAGQGIQLTWIQVNTCAGVADLERLLAFARDLALWPADELRFKSVPKQHCSAGYARVRTYMGRGTPHLPGMQNAVFGGCRHPPWISLATRKSGGRVRPVKGKTPLPITSPKCSLCLYQCLYTHPQSGSSV